MTDGAPPFVCPRCKGPLDVDATGYRCQRCAATYPIFCGIPDFRLNPDPYIGMEDDRRKGERLSRDAAGRTFAELVRHYYAITPEDPPDLAERWTSHALAEVAIADETLRDAGLLTTSGGPRALLDMGCSTGALLVAAAGACRPLVGVDVAFRWLVVGAARLREAGVTATLVCANAEHLPFADGAFHVVTATDVFEHVRDPRAMVREAYRVSAPDAVTYVTANNRFWPGVEPNVRIWGVGYLPKRWQAAWVGARRRDLHPYRLALPSAAELRRAFRDARFREIDVEPALLLAPHGPQGAMQALMRAYNAARRLPIARSLLTLTGPRLRILGKR